MCIKLIKQVDEGLGQQEEHRCHGPTFNKFVSAHDIPVQACTMALEMLNVNIMKGFH